MLFLRLFSSKKSQPDGIGLSLLIWLFGMLLFLAGCQAAAQPEITLTRSPAVSTRTGAPSFTSSTPSPVAPTLTSLPSAAAAIEASWNFDKLPLSETSYLIPLTIRHAGETSVVLTFALDGPVEGVLFVRRARESRGPMQTIPFFNEIGHRSITIENLIPETEYEAVIGLLDEEGDYVQPAFLGSAWGPIRFRTQSTGGPLRVGVIGDSGFGEQVTLDLVNRMAEMKLDFVIHTGDLVYRGADNTDPAEAFALKFYRPFSPILHEMPVYAVPGNHEYENAVRWQEAPFYYYAFPSFTDPRFENEIGSSIGQFYAVAYREIQFLLLDSEAFYGVAGREDQDDWLWEHLVDKRFAYSIPIFHIPPFTSSEVHPEDSSAPHRFWHPLFAGARVPLVLTGHNHHYERLQADGVTYIVSGGGSAALYPAKEIIPQSELFSARSHFVLLEIYSDRIEISAIDRDGEVFDRSVVPLDYPPPFDN